MGREDRSGGPTASGRQGEVVFIGAAERPSTGGEKYGREVIDALARSCRVEEIGFADLPPAARGYLASNRWLLTRYAGRLGRLTIVEDHFWHPRTFAFNWFARLRGARIVVIVHHLYHRLRRRRWQRALDRWLELLALASSHRIIVNSRVTADEVVALGIPRSRIVILPPGVDRIPDATARGWRPVLRLLAVGNLTQRKGLDVLLEALAQVRFPFELHLVGDPDYEPEHRARLEELVAAAQLVDRVAFRGRLSPGALAEAYRSADVFVAPSRWEGFGMALLDALLHGLPVVASAVGAIPELVEHGDNGLLVPPGNPAALAAALERLAADDDLRRRMGERARARGLRAARPWRDVAADAVAVVVGSRH
jgi:glycosyltransferase involved in cell wall biosynthesis